jgi:hypothetical protein
MRLRLLGQEVEHRQPIAPVEINRAYVHFSPGYRRTSILRSVNQEWL